MKPFLTVFFLVAIFISVDGLAQGNPEAKGGPSVSTQRSSEYEVESKSFEKYVPVTLEYNTGACSAELFLEYFQKETDAHVKIVLNNEECGASSGNYTIRVRYKDAQGELGLVEFEEAWNRDDDGNVVNEKDYFVGDDIDIVRVNSRRLSCSCKEAQSTKEELDDNQPQ